MKQKTRLQLWIATNSVGKVNEFKQLFAAYDVDIKSLNDLDQKVEIVEDGHTFEQNALKKATTLSRLLHQPVLADDSGLSIDALNGFPGVYTRRWSDPVTNNVEQNKLLLAVMSKMENRKAHATCALAYVDSDRNVQEIFVGVREGIIFDQQVGVNGFGFDPIFYLPELGKCYAQLSAAEKNELSHRHQATTMFMNWWKKQATTPQAHPFKLHVVMYEPEIAGNVGTIMRTCVALNAKLHLIEPFGFFLDDRFVVRASANYIEFLDYVTYADWNDFCQKNQFEHIYCSTRHGLKTHDAIDFAALSGDVYVMFGRESTGIPKSILRDHVDDCFRIPMSANVRSLNVANTVNIVGYEIMRQRDYPGLSKIETQKDPFLLLHDEAGGD